MTQVTKFEIPSRWSKCNQATFPQFLPTQHQLYIPSGLPAPGLALSRNFCQQWKMWALISTTNGVQ